MVERYPHTLGSLIKKEPTSFLPNRSRCSIPVCSFHLKGLVSTWAFSQKEQTVTAEVKGVLFRKASNTEENNSRRDTAFWECVKVMSKGYYHCKNITILIS